MFAIFAGDRYYPAGGWNDFITSFDNLNDAIEYLARGEISFDWAQIVDLTTKTVVWKT